MIKLLARGLLLLLPFAVLVVWYELSEARASDNLYVVKKHLLDAAAEQLEVLTLGSSHGYHGILPGLLGPKAFNLAAPSQSIYYDVELTLAHLGKLPRLQDVILPISYFSLESELDQGIERWRCYYYYRIFAIPHRDRKMAHDVRNFSLYFLYGRHADEIVRNDPSKDFDPSGGLIGHAPSSTKTPDELRAEGAARVKRHEGMLVPENLAGNIAALGKLQAELARRHIRLTLLTPPCTSYYRDVVHAAHYQRMQSALQEFSQKTGVTYRNYFDDHRFTSHDFMDTDHLSYAGAVKFSRLLAEEVLHSGQR